MVDLDQLFIALSRSTFRAKFKLRGQELQILREKGIDAIMHHAADLIGKRLAPAMIRNDGKQTPMRNHPVFVAQHATATCCRGCLQKWHHIPRGHTLEPKEIERVLTAIRRWLETQTPVSAELTHSTPAQPESLFD